MSLRTDMLRDLNCLPGILTLYSEMKPELGLLHKLISKVSIKTVRQIPWGQCPHCKSLTFHCLIFKKHGERFGSIVVVLAWSLNIFLVSKPRYHQFTLLIQTSHSK